VDVPSGDEGRRPREGLEERANRFQDLSRDRGSLSHRGRDNIPAVVFRGIVPLSLLVALGLAALAADATPPTPAPSRPARIVSLTPALTETLFAIGAGDRVVGVTAYCDYPPEAKTRPKVGGYVNPSVEAVVALKPDLVVVSPGPGNRDAALAMQRAGLRVEVVAAETLEESLKAIDTVASLCGDAAAGRRLSSSVRARLDAVARGVAGRRRVPTLFCIQTEPIFVAGRDTLPAQLLEIAGGRNVVQEPRYPRVGLETVIAAKPELILQARMDLPADGEHAEETFWARWPQIPAVAAHRVVVLTDGLALRPGPRVADAAEALERIVHAGAAAKESPR
jgi:iron complex transport system substrate-binding protein